ncbi:hypothetical protein CRG98_027055 [Punica granatum]|uniref:Uncharacterized protein n=1 Tax=Punica granatum TaxID=22663 RepID=A0A2I0J8Y5_PUNGR|nr:hypothetical protein CRG98_027055 [Punica granatum]
MQEKKNDQRREVRTADANGGPPKAQGALRSPPPTLQAPVEDEDYGGGRPPLSLSRRRREEEEEEEEDDEEEASCFDFQFRPGEIRILYLSAGKSESGADLIRRRSLKRTADIQHVLRVESGFCPGGS